FIALGGQRSAAGLRVAATQNITHERATQALADAAGEIEECLSSLRPVRLDIRDTPAASQRTRFPPGQDLLVLVPVLALQQPIGVLVLAGNRGNADLKDDQLTTSLGIALGLSLENLKQREDLHESEERLRTVVTGAPIVLFATDADGVFTLVEGRAFDALNVDAAQVVGRSVTQVYAGRPELLADVYRALAGEEVT